MNVIGIATGGVDDADCGCSDSYHRLHYTIQRAFEYFDRPDSQKHFFFTKLFSRTVVGIATGGVDDAVGGCSDSYHRLHYAAQRAFEYFDRSDSQQHFFFPEAFFEDHRRYCYWWCR